MSADNYYLIRKINGRFVVSMGFASNEGDPAPRKTDPHFSTLREALDYANNEYSEYGVRMDASLGEDFDGA